MKKTLITLLTAATIVSLGTVPVSKKVFAEDKKTTQEQKKDDAKGAEALFSFKVTVEGEEFTFPMSYEEVEKKGWKIAEDNLGEVIPSAKYLYGIKAVKDGKEIELTLINDKDENNIPVNEGTVVGVRINQSSYIIEDPSKKVEFKVPGGATNETKKEEVQKLYGEPKSKYSGSDRTSMKYEKEYYQGVEFNFDDKANRLSDFKMENIPSEAEVKAMIKENMANGTKKTDDKKDSKADDKKDSKAEDKKVEKIELGSELTDYTVEIDGEVFKAPTDFATLKAAGWDIHPDAKGSKVPAGKYTMGTKLVKGDLTIEGDFLNTSEELIPLEDAQIIKLTVDNYDALRDPAKHVKFKLPKDITEKSSYEDVVKAYGEPKSKNESGDSIYATWEEDNHKSVKFIFNTKTKMVEKLEVENYVEE